jgi:peptidoglycan/LPS O-acetylase OafA/YrhL
VLFFARDAATQFRQDVLAALTYMTNWWYVFDDQSYFEVMGRPPMLLHLWSLAIEEQFYLIWPTAAFLSWRKWGRRGVGVVAVCGALVSTLWMSVLAVMSDAPAAADTARIYFGTDTHGMTVLAGAALAVVWRPSLLPKAIPGSAQIALTTLGTVSLLALAAFFTFVSEGTSWLYRGGFLVLAIAGGGLIVASSHPAGRFGRAMGNPIMGWMGTRSYGIYLWHWPVFLVTRPDLDLRYGGFWAAATSLALTFLAAEVSYRYIEMPVRRGALAAMWRRAQYGGQTVRTRMLAAVGGVLVALVATAVAVAAVPPITADDYLGGVTSVGAGALPTNEPNGGSKDGGKGDEGGDKADDANVPITERTITAVGDSVLLSARLALQERMPKMHVDAEISRQPYDTLARIRERFRADAMADVLVIQTGTNGVPVEDDLRSVLDKLHELDRVVLVNVRSPVPWMDQSNRILESAARGFDNVVVADWAGASAGEESYFVFDGTHLTPKGTAAYARVVREALRTDNPVAD